MNDLTQMLNSNRPDGPATSNELLSLVYEELRRLAAAKMVSEAPGQTLQATALVHEAWLRVTNDEKRKWNDRTHFFAAAAEAMRRILVDNARRKQALRHGGQMVRVEISDLIRSEADDDNILAVNEALEKLAQLDPEKAELVKMRYFVGMTLAEASEVLGISERTAKRYWAFARAWLHEEINAKRPNP